VFFVSRWWIVREKLPQRHREHGRDKEKFELAVAKNESVRGALRPEVVVGAKYVCEPELAKERPNVIARRRVKKNAL
jgi:hypothetical protein